MKKIIMALLIASVFSFSCKDKKNDKFKIPEKSQIFALASPVDLSVGQTTIYLNDYFTDANKIDSFSCNKNLSYKLLKDSAKLLLKIKSNKLPQISVLNAFCEGYKYSLLLKKSSKIKHKFIFDPHGQSYNSVKIRGEMTAWAAKDLKFDEGVWSTEMILEPGKYQYLLIIDNNEQLDPNNPDSISNNIGGFNSLLKIGKAKKTKKPFIFTYEHNDKNIKLKYNNKIKNIIAFYNNHNLPKSFITKKDSIINIKIPEQAKKFDRSYIRVWAFNKADISNDIKIPLKNGKIITNTNDLKRTDYESAIIYNVFVDRFYDGNADNNRPINDSSIVLPPADFHGGDIAGVLKILNKGYFDSLSVNTIWLSPIVKNVEGAFGQWKNPKTKFSAYHGYWPLSFTQIDSRFGTEKEFKNLVNSLHENNKNILVDFVAHHLHEKSPIIKNNPQWKTELYLSDGTLNTEKWDDQRLTTWFDVFLPTLDNRKPEVANLVSDSAVFWLKKYNIDGFRHDAAKHVPLSFWRMLTYKTKRQYEVKNNKKIYQIGETYGSHELVGSYVNSGMLNAQFDFNLYDAITASLASGSSFKNLKTALNKSFKYYGWHNIMGNITGNQDRGRFISYAGESLKFDEDAKVAGWTRNITVGDSSAYKKSAMLFAFISTIPGIPVIYYGDEIGMPGGNDPDNRRMMKFDNLSKQQKKLKNTVAKLLKLRKNSMELIFGDFKFLLVEDKILAYQRNYFDQTTIIILNNSSKTQFINVPLNKNYNYKNMDALIDCCFSISKNELSIELEPFSFEIITN